MAILPLEGRSQSATVLTNGSGQWIEAGSYTEPLEYTSATLTLTNLGTFDIVNTDPSHTLGLYFYTLGPDGATGSSGGAGANPGAIVVLNEGAVTFSNAVAADDTVIALYAAAFGGNGGNATNSHDDAGAGGNVPSGVILSNTAPITLLGDGFAYGAPALAALAQAGSGGNVATNGNNQGIPTFDGGRGGEGGFTGTVAVYNAGAIAVGSDEAAAFGSSGLNGISAVARGGDAGAGAAGAAGGGAGQVIVSNSAPITVYFAWDVPVDDPAGPSAISAWSFGGAGQYSAASHTNGGEGGSGGPINITVTPGADLSVTVYNAANPDGSAVIQALSTGNSGGAAFTSSTGGAGGAAGMPGLGGPELYSNTISVVGANVNALGNNLMGIFMQNKAGAGGDGGMNQDSSSGGAGGAAAGMTFTITGTSDYDMTVSTAGAFSAAIAAEALGGAGGAGTDYTLGTSGNGGAGGAGGSAGPIEMLLGGGGATTSVLTDGTNSPGVYALSQGGAGGKGGDFGDVDGDAGAGGAAGSAGAVSVSLGSGVSITTQKGQSPGVVAISSGGLGGDAGDSSTTTNDGQPGGAGGNAGNVSVTNNAGVTISTAGEESPGIVAQSLSGGGGGGGSVDNSGSGQAGPGGAGGDTGEVGVFNEGAISTGGTNAHGILAQALSGAGGAAGDATGFFYAGGGSSSSSGVVNSVTVLNAGSITTAETNAHGIIAQSIAGGGGAGGEAQAGIASLGGNATNNPVTADGGAITMTNSGSIATAGGNSMGLLAQSIGGGGGDGGAATGMLVSIGGSGGAGGAGGNVNIFGNGGLVTTEGSMAHGVVAQSIGGGGGNAGSATNVSVDTSVAIGGSGGGGGNGGNVTLDMTNLAVTNLGNNAAGIVAQSIGGGGGSGGAAYAYDVDVKFTTAVAVGGDGGDGGAGGVVLLNVFGGSIATGQSPLLIDPPPPGTGPTNVLSTDAYGLVAQSIGGGGGLGGAASAEALSIAIPDTSVDNIVNGSFVYANGGNGGDGGDGSTASLSFGSNSTLTTSGQGSHGIIAHSVGGGGGLGGDSSALAATLGYGREAQAASSDSWTVDVAVALGGTGGGGGAGGYAAAFVGDGLGGGAVSTYGDYADGVLVQSIGGGGGNAGFGSTTTQQFGGTRDLTVGVALGTTGGTGGDGGIVELSLSALSSITTYGSGAVAMTAQSIGGGGGTSQGGSINLGATAMFPVVGEDNQIALLSVTPGAELNIGLGATGAGGGDGGDVTVHVGGHISTMRGDATGVLAQSIGGGGGLAGSAGADASADNPAVPYALGLRQYVSDTFEADIPFTASLNVSLGSSGGAGGDGGSVDVTLEAGHVVTQGDWSQGLVAQSVGGGGGKGGTATGTGSGAFPIINLNLGFNTNNLGHPGSGGTGGPVTVQLTGGHIATGSVQTNQTTGYSAFGVVAQSIGGGGGMAADGSDLATGFIAVGGTTNGVGGSSGDGGAVIVAGTNAFTTAIETAGEAGHGMVLQSVGGSGGIAGAGSSVVTTQTVAPVSVAVGGGSNALGAGGSVTVTNTTLVIDTTGDSAFGIVAQSIGGGGGIGAAKNSSDTAVALGGNFAEYLEDSDPPDVNGGIVDVNLQGGSSITTAGGSAIAIVAQSIGGGGGIANYAGGDASLAVTGIPARYDSMGYGAAVTVNVDADIVTSGNGAHGILAQSVGGGGGLLGTAGTLFAGSTGGAGSHGLGGEVAVVQSGTLSATGTNATAIFAQSTAPLWEGQDLTTGSAVMVMVNGTVTGGSVDAYGVWVDGGNGDNLVTIGTTGSVGALSGQAINYTGNATNGFAILNVNNEGTVNGSVNLSYATGPPGTFTNNGTWNAGAGAVLSGNIADNGLVRIGEASGSPGLLTVNGDYTQGISGVLRMTIAGLEIEDYDTIDIAGHAEFSGVLQLTFTNYSPDVGAMFTLISGATGTFDFIDVDVSGLIDGILWTTNQVTSETQSTFVLEVTAVPEPSTVVLMLFSASLLAIPLVRRFRADRRKS